VLTSKTFQNVDGLVVCYSTDGWIGVLIALQASMVQVHGPRNLPSIEEAPAMTKI